MKLQKHKVANRNNAGNALEHKALFPEFISIQ